jgi:hypothetical protein
MLVYESGRYHVYKYHMVIFYEHAYVQPEIRPCLYFNVDIMNEMANI